MRNGRAQSSATSRPYTSATSRLQASPFHSWRRQDWSALRLILFGWGSNLLALIAMSFTFAAYGCELFEPANFASVDTEGMSWSEGATEYALLSNITLAEQLARGDFGIAWALSAFQRFVLHEPTLILAFKGLPVLFASAFCMNCCGETIVNLLTVGFSVCMAFCAELTRG